MAPAQWLTSAERIGKSAGLAFAVPPTILAVPLAPQPAVHRVGRAQGRADARFHDRHSDDPRSLSRGSARQGQVTGHVFRKDKDLGRISVIDFPVKYGK